MSHAAMRTERPVILVPVLREYDSGFWLGGRNYLISWIHALETLPASEQPRIIVAAAPAAPADLVAELFKRSSAILLFNMQGRIDDMKPVLRRWLKRHGATAEERLRRIFDSIVASFPVLGPEMQVPRPIFWIPDFQHRRLPDQFSERERAERDRIYGLIATKNERLILSSRDVLKDFREFYPEAAVRPHVWSFVTSLDPSVVPPEDPRPRFGLPEKYLYLPNQFWRHKNHITAIRALSILRANGIDATLVCTGGPLDYRWPDHFSRLQQAIGAAGLNDRVRYLGIVSREQQIQLFRYAAAVIQPSLFEGWSTVVEDTKSMGRPLIASDIPVHREQADARTLFFKPTDPENLATVIARVYGDLRPGPDLAMEREATQTRIARQKSAAREFMRIATSPPH